MDKNYITPAGFRKLQAELKRLRTEERPQVTETVAWAAGNGDRSENGDYIYGKKRLRQIDGRIRFLTKQLEAAELVEPTSIAADDIRFGATVTIEDQDGTVKTYSIVGKDEADLDKGYISWQSPLAKALMKKKIGDLFTFHSPRGEHDIEVLDFRYVELE